MMSPVLFIIFLASAASCQADEGQKCDCTYNKCTPTCSLLNPPNCTRGSNPCNCPQGTVISDKGGKCVPREECQKYVNCKGDYNARYSDCPIACPSTCAKPNAEHCNTTCGNLGCVCNYGYILSEINGKCIKVEDCPGGKVCKENEVFSNCVARCPTDYCPTNDSQATIACSAPYPCPSRCMCKANHKLKSVKEPICIPTTECPPVNCTRSNEKWNPSPEPCFSDSCSTRNQVITPDNCPYNRNSKPQCVCTDGYLRNRSGFCVLAENCPN